MKQELKEQDENKTELQVSDCCQNEMIPPDWEAAEEAGSMWRAYAVYICKKCGNVCTPI